MEFGHCGKARTDSTVQSHEFSGREGGWPRLFTTHSIVEPLAATITRAGEMPLALARGKPRFGQEALDLPPVPEHVHDRVFEHLLEVVLRQPP